MSLSRYIKTKNSMIQFTRRNWQKILQELGYNAKLEMKISETGEKFLDISFQNEKLSEFAKELSTRREEVLAKAQELGKEFSNAHRAEVESIAAKATRQDKQNVDISKVFENVRQEFENRYGVEILRK